MEKKPPLKHECYFHIYNRGTNSCNLFNENDNYMHFLSLYNIFIEPVAKTYAWVLMPNHFHLLVKIKEENEIGYLIPENKEAKDLAVKWKTFFPDENYPKEKLESLKKPNPERQFGHLFNAHAKHFNNKYGRTGKLFEERFERKPVDNQVYRKYLVCYIHKNPTHHDFTQTIEEYPWTSYPEFPVEKQNIIVSRNEVLGWFGGIHNFKAAHKSQPDLENLDDYIIE